MRGHFFAYRDVGTSRSAGRRVSDVAYRDGRFGRPVLTRHSYILYIVGTVALARPVLRDIRTSVHHRGEARERCACHGACFPWAAR
jgi:hypothetical protein